MGKNNRQRREDKHRRRDRRRRAHSHAPTGPGGFRVRADELPTDLLLMTAIEAVARGDALDERLLAEMLSRPDARRRTAQVLADLLAEMAQHGWEERLLANFVRRELSARHAKVITNLDTPEGLQPAIEVLALIGQLPPLTPLPASTKIDEADARILAKVRGLLAKAESTTFPEEAEALSAKAQELMARHAIDHALAATAAAPEKPGGRRLPVEDPYADAKAMLISSVSRANRCKAVHIFNFGHVTLLGFESDLVAVELLFTSLLVQANRAMLAAGREDPRSRQPSFRRSFLAAYATRIGQRLEACTSAQVADADADEGGRLLPVLAARDDAVDEAVEAMFGDRLVRREARISDPRGWVAGNAAADLADLAVGPEVRAAS